MEKCRYHEMLPHEITARRKKFPVAFLPVGGLEWHGEHNAVGLDALKAESLCEMAARESGGFCMPTVWYSDPRAHALMEATVDPDGDIKRKMKFRVSRYSEKFWGKDTAAQEEFYQGMVRHILMQMYTLEMKAVVMLCGHYPLYHFALPVIEQLKKELPAMPIFCGTEIQFITNKRIAWGDHASKWETSYLWYLRPDCVDMSVYLGRDDEKKLIGCPGEDPRYSATVETGRRACRHVVDMMLQKAQELLDLKT